MNISEIMATSIERAKRWHGGSLDQWSVLEWAGAMCGEAGECANAAKKLKRLQDQIQSINESGRHYTEADAASLKVVQEVCDTILYAVLVAAAAGCEPEALEHQLAYIFNRKSEEYGFPERLHAEPKETAE